MSDIEVIQTELCLADLATVEKGLQRAHQARQGRRRQGGAAPGRRAQPLPGRAESGPAGALARLQQGRAARCSKPLCLITAKPAMFVGQRGRGRLRATTRCLRAAAANTPPVQNAPVVAICAKTEAELADMDDEDTPAVPGRDGPERAGPEPADPRRPSSCSACRPTSPPGRKEVRAWTIHVGDTAPQAAGVIHTDFERGFIRAQTIAFDDYIASTRRAGRQGGREDARRGQGVRRQGWRRDELPVQRLRRTFMC